MRDGGVASGLAAGLEQSLSRGDHKGATSHFATVSETAQRRGIRWHLVQPS